ncbi:MAG TPA: hypothetical protein VHE77_05340 [Dongiaceae bacterium]|nr:hypothetical protein [Dongiaceae bacterium]
MRSMRYFVAGLLGLAAGGGTLWGISGSGIAGEGGLAGGLYSSLILYPAALLAFAIVFWIVFAAMDPGSEQ